MATNFRERLKSDFKTIELLHSNTHCKIELVENLKSCDRFIKKTYFEDKREIFHLLSQAVSPYLVQIKEIFFDSDTIVIEEYIEGEPLDQYLLHTFISSKQAVKIVRELLAAVSCIHKLGIIHRDIKPENILIDTLGDIRLIDFGIARIYRPNEVRDTELLGTVGYAAPEQFGYAQSDFRTDIFSIGMTCRDINCVCGKSRILKKIEQKCIKMDPMERYQDVASILMEFKKDKRRKCEIILFVSIFFMSGIMFCLSQKVHKNKEGDLIRTFDENALFSGRKPVPCLLLAADEEKKTQIDIAGQDDLVDVQAQLGKDGLALSIINSDGIAADFMLCNEYEIIRDYPDTSLYAEVLFYDTDHNGRNEIWVAVSDRKYIILSDGTRTYNQNYMAGWCIDCTEDGIFYLADGQLVTKGYFDVDNIFLGGIWQNYELSAYQLENGRLVQVEW